MVSYGTRTPINPTPAQSPVTIDIWSEPMARITIDDAPAVTLALPSVVVPVNWLPTGCVIDFVFAMLKFRVIRTLQDGATNKLDGDQNIQVRKSPAGGWLNCINLKDDMLNCKNKEPPIECGMLLIGEEDIKAVVDADNVTYDFQWLNSLSDMDDLQVHDIQMGLRIIICF